MPVVDKAQHEARLRRLIARGIKMEKLKKRLKDQLEILTDNIQDLMSDLDLKRYVGSTGEALVVPAQTREWDMAKLEDVLTRTQWKQYCPPKANGAALSKLLESLTIVGVDEVAKAKLEACSEVTPTPWVRLAAPKAVKERAAKPVTEPIATKEEDLVGGWFPGKQARLF